MATTERSTALTTLARAGFTSLTTAEHALRELSELTGRSVDALTADAAVAADPDGAADCLVRVARRDPSAVARAFERDAAVVWRVFGASEGLADFYFRHPDELAELPDADAGLPRADESRAELLAAVGAEGGFAASGDEKAWCALRVRYRRILARIASVDLQAPDPIEVLPEVASALADLAGAALEASLAVGRTRVSSVTKLFPREDVAATELAIIGMGKAGARELNYVSDVDVIFVGGPAEGSDLTDGRAIDIATRLAVQTMRGISGAEVEPPLWEVDANLRPEGSKGALVRTLASHLSYYDRWAASWEFQALLKARPLAGSERLGQAYIDAVRPLVWTSASRENFVDSVQRMRERVTEHIPADEVPLQLKLGPGGIRDIEFTVQLLQLVHGLTDDGVRDRRTTDALDALMDRGYIGREEAATFARDYRILRVLEHRMQLKHLRRTHLMPDDEDGRRILARSSGLAGNGDGIWELWLSVRREVREIHVRLFYRPLLSAVAELPAEAIVLTSEQAHARLAAIGFHDPGGALRHIAALTAGVSRKATIQRHLLPVMLRWFAEGVDPDNGLLAFRRISERLGETPWFLRALRDSSGAAERLTKVLSGSRYIADLMEWIPESVAWLDQEGALVPRTGVALQQEARAIQARHTTIDDAMGAIRALRRREMLRLAIIVMISDITIEQLAASLTAVTEVTLQATLRAVRREVVPPEDDALDFSIIGMGRLGGSEQGFGSDADVLYVYEANGVDPGRAQTLATAIVNGIRTHSEDHRLPLELDADLRPEGRKGPMVRSLEAYANYYRRWSVSWEAQALLRARGIAGSVKLITKFMALADELRYPTSVDPQAIREIKRIKARVENERLPQGVDRSRHLKLGPGGLSDVEWLVQTLQLQHAAEIPALRTTSTMDALDAAREAGLIAATSADRLAAAWRLASRLRSANTLLSRQTSDVLPADRDKLDGIGRILELPPRSATVVEEQWMAASRRARRVFEKLFYGLTDARPNPAARHRARDSGCAR